MFPDLCSANLTVKGHAERQAVNFPVQGTCIATSIHCTLEDLVDIAHRIAKLEGKEINFLLFLEVGGTCEI